MTAITQSPTFKTFSLAFAKLEKQYVTMAEYKALMSEEPDDESIYLEKQRPPNRTISNSHGLYHSKLFFILIIILSVSSISLNILQLSFYLISLRTPDHEDGPHYSKYGTRHRPP